MALKSKKELTRIQIEKEMARLLCAVNPLDVVTADKTGKKVYLGGKEATDLEMTDLKADAIYFKKSRLWAVLSDTVRDQAMKVMFEKSETFEDMRTGKMMLYNIDIQQKIVNLLESYARSKQ